MSIKNKLILYFLGDHSVGKSTILFGYVNNLKNTVEPTKDIKIFKKAIKIKKNNSMIKVYLELWDICGNLVFANSLKKIKDTKSIFIFVYDITNKDSFNNLIKWKELVSDSKQNAMIVIIGNKNDLLGQKEVSTEEGINLAKSIDALFFEISAKDKVGEINKIFEIIIDKYYTSFPEGLIDPEEEEMNLSFNLPPKKQEKEKSSCCECQEEDLDKIYKPNILYKFSLPIKNIENPEEKTEEENEGRIKYRIKYTNGDIYKGECINNLREGNGIMEYNNGNIYSGEWKKDKREGKGTLEYRNGEIFDGEWEKGKLLN